MNKITVMYFNIPLTHLPKHKNLLAQLPLIYGDASDHLKCNFKKSSKVKMRIAQTVFSSLELQTLNCLVDSNI